MSEMKMYDQLSEMIFRIDVDAQKITYRNMCAEKILWSHEEQQKAIDVVLAGRREESLSMQIGTSVFELISYDEQTDENTILVVGKNNHHLASQDRLTGLANADYFYEIAGEIVDGFPDASQLAIVYFNIDNFKSFNSEYGYEEGDRVLKRLAELLFETFTHYVVGRTSNDHFIVLTNREEVLKNIHVVHEAMQHLPGNMRMEICVGIYEYEKGVSITQAHDYAKLACDIGRNDYSSYYCYYDDSLRKRLLKEKYIVDHLDEAIEKEYLLVYYQPIMRVLSHEMCAMECLVRWADPELGFLSPAEFIPILEKRKLIYKLDAFVLDRVCRDFLTSMSLGADVVPVSVNVSRVDFKMTDVCEVFRSTTEKYGISPSMINIEVTESALNDDVNQLVETIDQLHQEGFEIWLDDFGSEYSSLNSLQNYHFDLLKIDMKFFENFSGNEDAKTILMAVCDMAKRLHMRVLAEGIETGEQYEFLNELGCDKAQGYYMCRPIPIEDIYEKEMKMETPREKMFYDTVGQVNFLSPNPLEDYQDADKLYNLVPTAIVQYKNDHFHYLYVNKGFDECLKSMGVPSVELSERYINSDLAKLKIRFKEVSAKTHRSMKLEGVDFIFKGYQVNVRGKEIAYVDGVQALFVTMFNLSTLDNVKKMEQLETSLNYLYSIYARVDLIDVTNDTLDNVYLSSIYYRTSFQGKNLQQCFVEYAENEIAPEDRKKFLMFYDMDTIYERIEKGGKEYVVQTIRTMTQLGGVQLQIYIIIRINDGEAYRYLSCVRDVVAEMDSRRYDVGDRVDNTHSALWYQKLMDEVKVAAFEWNLLTGESYISDRAYLYVLCKSKMEDILQNRGDLESVYPEDVPTALHFFEKTKSGCERVEEWMRLKMIDGTYRLSKIIGKFQYDEQGSLTHALGLIVDLESEQDSLKQTKLLNQMPLALGVFEVLDGITRQIYMNSQYYELVEDEREKRKQNCRTFLDGIHPDEREQVMCAMKRVIDGENHCSGICRVVTGRGDYKWMRFYSSVAKREENHILVYSIYLDLEDSQLKECAGNDIR